MHLHRTQNSLPALDSVEVRSLSSFPAYNLATHTNANPQAREAEETWGAATVLRRSHAPEIRGLPLPFAAPLLSHTDLAAV
jgi:hypothetical protein